MAPKKCCAKHEQFRTGDYRWVAQVVNHLVFADPSHQEARDCKRCFEQLGYQAESGTGAMRTFTGHTNFATDLPTSLLVGGDNLPSDDR
ncbi:MAG: hypothetical protein Ct9H300mP26_5670 [Acidimicrobiales bacterium]|nr:MAG: hypothetical protein Ct9H300mP26_5670 [Acidimicrobiales bacterium]